MSHHFSLASYLQIKNRNVFKHIINNNLEQGWAIRGPPKRF